MKYQKKIHGCPYRSGDGKCVHKTPVRNKSKKMASCPYSKPESCRMYNEWLELKKDDSEALYKELEYIKKGAETNEK